ncbi:type II toxin-antitoxin system Phd/YefM family antitoxin [Limnospira fusiformis]|uniref:type II toxin-antitoxin system Phd/YefM family antitoxin n=1 Tax=Limnospira fusiformis TaxID=54297 RepID=UPI001449815C|nr:type II toxin-antitoxin system prevent-host-death family antitoxin [Limnospira fusiformis SAG 85.79]
MYHIDLSDAHLNLSELVEKALSGQEVFITKDNQPLVKLVSVSPPEKLSNREPGTAENLVQVCDDSCWESQELVTSSKLNQLEEKLEYLNQVFDQFKKMVADLRD